MLNQKFVVTPKTESSVTVTVRIEKNHTTDLKS